MTEELPDEIARFVAQAAIPIAVARPGSPDRPLIAVNSAFCALTGYGRDELIGRDCRLLQGERTAPESQAAMREFFADGAARHVRLVLINYRKDGRPFANFVFLSKLTGIDGETEFLFASQFDVSQSAPDGELSYERALGEGLADLHALGRAHRLGVETSFASLAASAHAIASARLTLASIEAQAS